MKRFAFLLLAAALLSLRPSLYAQTPKTMSLDKTLRENRWQKRVLLLVAPTAQDADFRQQKALLAAQASELAERDFLVIELLNDQLSPASRQFFIQKTGLPPTRFAAVLIGKDGGVKEKSSRPMKPEDLFGTVDKMPMRREEMKRVK
ncbi:DUF4174 domain-containing protein [Hymenobacter sp. M29]|uniref:DUF4174 domain-containing protein n=1 Tax=Hymenobacter mellowenesis TaxID=3063995 RepID=A0ABT9A8F2_9BACT|nr:DUF4174 domain-containing protein [Hymenobacter sp. M29]MDO7846117.1 DUF4174 domain-containing protein [Hymenobacter sp. M29]